MKSKRIKWLDFAKGFAILGVVVDHSSLLDNSMFFELIRYVLLIFVMPIFFAISGYLYRSCNSFHKFKILLYKKASSFLIPYFIFTLIAIMIDFSKKVFNHIYSFNYLKFILLPFGYMWFLYALFFIFLIIGVMDLFKVNLFIQLSISIILMIGQIYLPWRFTKSGNVNPLAGIGSYMVFFYIGFIMKKYGINELLRKKVIGNSAIILWTILMILQIVLGNISINTDLINYNDMVIKLLCVPAFFALFMRLNTSSLLFRYFDRYGKYTLIIYLCQTPILNVLTFILKRIISNDFVIFPIDILMAWVIAISIVHLSFKNRFINFVFYPRKYITCMINKNK